MKKAFTHEYFIIRRKQHNLGSPDTCSVLNDFLLPSCSSHLSLTTLSVSQTLQRGRPGAAVSPQPRGRTGAQDPKPRGGGSQERASTCLWPFVSSEEKASSSREGLSIVCREKKKKDTSVIAQTQPVTRSCCRAGWGRGSLALRVPIEPLLLGAPG